MGHWDKRTKGQWDSRTKGQWDNRTMGQKDNRTMGNQERGWTGQWDKGETEQQDNEWFGQRENGTIGNQDYGISGNNRTAGQPDNGITIVLCINGREYLCVYKVLLQWGERCEFLTFVTMPVTLGSECDEYIRIFEYIGHKYLFGHSFVSTFLLGICSNIRLREICLNEYIRIIVRECVRV